jgi:hypothetical protein
VLRELGVTLKIVLAATFAAVAYGVAHDMVTAHLCLEYFTIGHPNLLRVDPHDSWPVWQALLWGVLATWWVGAIAGVLVAAVSRLGGEPRLGPSALWRPVLRIYAATASGALLFGLLGAALATGGAIHLVPRLAEAVPSQRHVAFLADAWAHGAAYAVGGLGVLITLGHLVMLRRRRALAPASVEDPAP